ncbi:squalene cyclase [Mycobacterium sp. djl-10]|nr:squalene cyclase [Mycobacterium sp. djl-10]
MPHDSVVAWLLDSDPALRWQVERDVLHAPPEVWQATRARVAVEGFGARLLVQQDADGQWAGGAFFPTDFDEEREAQPWTATTWALKDLREWGVDAAVLGDTAQRLAAHSRWEYDDLPFWGGEVDCCINAWTLASGVWLGVDVSGIADWFIDHQLPDGGWNCEWANGSTRSSFHSTLNALKGLSACDGDKAVRRSGEEYLLQRRLINRLSTGEPVAPWVGEFSFPFHWCYSVLNAADYFRAVGRPDPRLTDAITMIRDARAPDGTWHNAGRHPGRVWFHVDAPAGQPSKWLTLIALRVLDWWEVSRRNPTLT